MTIKYPKPWKVCKHPPSELPTTYYRHSKRYGLTYAATLYVNGWRAAIAEVKRLNK